MYLKLFLKKKKKKKKKKNILSGTAWSQSQLHCRDWRMHLLFEADLRARGLVNRQPYLCCLRGFYHL